MEIKILPLTVRLISVYFFQTTYYSLQAAKCPMDRDAFKPQYHSLTRGPHSILAISAGHSPQTPLSNGLSVLPP